MKTNFFIIISFVFILTNCTTSPINDGAQQNIIIQWHLINVKGGGAVVNNNFDYETIVWVFNPDGTITIENNNTDESLEDSLDSGTYEYTIAEIDNISYIYFPDTDEYGNIMFNSQNEIIINQNITSAGPITDGYIYTFERVLVVSDE